MRVVDDDLQAQRAYSLLVCVQVLHEKPTLVAQWLACAGSVLQAEETRQFQETIAVQSCCTLVLCLHPCSPGRAQGHLTLGREHL
jgi:hypothetical protein